MKNILKLAALIVVAGIGAFVIRALFVAASRPGAGAPAATVRIRVAADELPAGLLLRDSDLTWKPVLAKQVPDGALTEASGAAADLKGDLLRHAVHAGTPLGSADVIEPGSPGFLAAALKPGMRAISVSIDDVSGNAGLIQPGDYVDVLLTQTLRADATTNLPPTREVESETVAERVRVLAVGSAFQRPRESKTPASEVQPQTVRSNVRTATFEVTPAGAQAITVAAHLGTLSLALRSFATRDRHAADAEDIAQTRSPPVWAGDVSRALRLVAATQPGTAQQAVHHVIIYRGSQVDDTSGAPGNAGSTGTPGVPPLPPGMSGKAPATAAAAPAPVASGS